MSATTTQLLSSGEFCKLRYGTIPVKSASANVSFYTSNSKKCQKFELWHSCRKWAIYSATLYQKDWNLKFLQYIKPTANYCVLISIITIFDNNPPPVSVIGCFYIMWTVCTHIKSLYTSCT